MGVSSNKNLGFFLLKIQNEIGVFDTNFILSTKVLVGEGNQLNWFSNRNRCIVEEWFGFRFVDWLSIDKQS